MIVPDGLVWASVPVLTGAGYKACQWFVQDVVSRNKRNNRINRDIDEGPPPQPAPSQPAAASVMTIADFQAVAELLKKELNGRYMFAGEARDKFAAIERLIEGLARRLEALSIQINTCTEELKATHAAVE